MTQKESERSMLPIVAGIVLGGLIGGFVADTLRDQGRRKSILNRLSALDENTLQLRSYLSERIHAYRRSVEAEIKTSAERIKHEAEATAYSSN